MKGLLIFSIVLTGASCSAVPTEPARPTCNSVVAEIKAFRGLRLGMDMPLGAGMLSEIYNRDSVYLSKAEELGYRSATFYPKIETVYGREKFRGIPNVVETTNLETVQLEAIDGRLSRFELTYDDSADWPTLESVVEKFSESLGIARNSFRITSIYIAEATCSDFSVRLTAYKDADGDSRRNGHCGKIRQ